MEKLHTRIWGTAGERVILLHGGNVPDAAVTWAEQPPLADRFHLIVVERRGYGQSPRGPCMRSSKARDTPPTERVNALTNAGDS